MTETHGEVLVCACCHAPLVPESDGGEKLHALACYHAFHLECLTAYSGVKGVPISELNCPLCKLTEKDVITSSAATVDVDDSAGGDADIDRFMFGEIAASDAAQKAEPGAVPHPAHDANAAPTCAQSITASPVDSELATPMHYAVADVTGDTATVAATVVPPLRAAFFGDNPVVVALAEFATNDEALTVTCKDCLTKCDPVKSRMMSKKQFTFRCPKCETTMTRLHRQFGSGCCKRMLDIPELDRQNFLACAPGLNVGELKESLNHLLDKYEKYEEEYELGGTFKPLGVWQKLGYDTDLIEARSLPKNIAADRIFGTTYRVPLLTVTERTIKGRATSTEMTLASSSNAASSTVDKSHRGRSASHEPEKKTSKKKRKRSISSTSTVGSDGSDMHDSDAGETDADGKKQQRKSEKEQIQALKQKLREKNTQKRIKDKDKKSAADEKKIKLDAEREDRHLDDEHSFSNAQLTHQAGTRVIQPTNAGFEVQLRQCR